MGWEVVAAAGSETLVEAEETGVTGEAGGGRATAGEQPDWAGLAVQAEAGGAAGGRKGRLLCELGKRRCRGHFAGAGASGEDC